MKIGITINIDCKVDDKLFQEILEEDNITLEEYHKNLKDEVVELMEDTFDESEIESKNIDVKIYFEEE